MSDNASKEIYRELLDYVRKNAYSWSDVAAELKVTNNTVSNWNRGEGIGPRNRRAIRKMIDSTPKMCTCIHCTAKDTLDPITKEMFKTWNKLTSANRAELYAFAMVLKEKRDAAPVDFKKIEEEFLQ